MSKHENLSERHYDKSTGTHMEVIKTGPDWPSQTSQAGKMFEERISPAAKLGSSLSLTVNTCRATLFLHQRTRAKSALVDFGRRKTRACSFRRN